MATKIFLITHAVTQWHLAGRVQGHYDTVLNCYGYAMAEELANKLKDENIDLIVTSDLNVLIILPYLCRRVKIFQ